MKGVKIDLTIKKALGGMPLMPGLPTVDDHLTVRSHVWFRNLSLPRVPHPWHIYYNTIFTWLLGCTKRNYIGSFKKNNNNRLYNL